MFCLSLYPLTEGCTLVHHLIPVSEMSMLDHDHVFKGATAVGFNGKNTCFGLRQTWAHITALPLTVYELGQPIAYIKSKLYTRK